MRALVVVAMLVVGVPSVASSQETKLREFRGMHVAVIDNGSREWQGRLLDVGTDTITVEIDAGAKRFGLAEIKRVDAHGDKVWDGALKGAIVGVILGSLVLHSARFAAQSALAYGLVGAGMDALNNCTHTVYRAPAMGAAVTVSW